LSQPSLPNAKFTGICVDSRMIEPGNLFIALQGDQFDGHDFVKEAEVKGALAAVVNRYIDDVVIPQCIVSDTVDALAKIATAHRNTVTCPVIALTGSNGKTTVKEMIAAILPAPSHATKGNLNNHIGAPMSALQLSTEHRFAVFELGASNPLEIAHTVAIVQPDVTLINNIAPAHVEGFGSIDGVARSKGEIYAGLKPHGTAVINDDDAYAHFWDDILRDKKTIRFSANHLADVYAKDILLDAQGCGQFTMVLPTGQAAIKLNVCGEHNIRNALAAGACCYATGVSQTDIQRGLNQFSGVSGRLTFVAGINQATIIDDTYNANLRSVLAALEVLAKRPGEKIFVFGDMGELGAFTSLHHQEVGMAARTLGIDKLFTCGKHSELTTHAFGTGGYHCASKEEAVARVLPLLASQTTVLVKGSRSSAMEKVVQKLVD
jgi:UDP-N-acetylmuramoyl-tripeptide--D-alanyl-D-alanine ligase